MLQRIRDAVSFLFKDKAAYWTALFTAVLTFFTYKLVEVSTVTNDTARATQRAFISFAGISAGAGMVSNDRKAKISQEVLLNWTNSGTTPARNAVTNGNGDAWPSALPDGFNFPDLPTSAKQPITLGPKEISGIHAIIPINDFRTAWEGKSHLYVWGWIVYDDIFPGDPPRLTEFCAEMVQITIPQDKTAADFAETPNMPMGWNVTRCKEHNCYDTDCKDYSERVKTARAQ
jgi:hypothetical protein